MKRFCVPLTQTTYTFIIQFFQIADKTQFPDCQSFVDGLKNLDSRTPSAALVNFLGRRLNLFKEYFIQKVESERKLNAGKRFLGAYYCAASALLASDYNVMKCVGDIASMNVSSQIARIFGGDILSDRNGALKNYCDETVLEMWIMAGKCDHDMSGKRTNFPSYKEIQMQDIHQAMVNGLQDDTGDANAGSQTTVEIFDNIITQIDKQSKDQIRAAKEQLELRIKDKTNKNKCRNCDISLIKKSEQNLKNKMDESLSVPTLPSALNDAPLQGFETILEFLKAINERGRRVFHLMFVVNLELNLLSSQIKPRP